MKNKHKALQFVLGISFIIGFTTNNSHQEKRVKSAVASETNERLRVVREPFLKKVSLGSELFTDGLVVAFDNNIIEDYTINSEDYDKNNLGTQTIGISYQNFTSSFNTFVTNEFAHVGDYLDRGVFISNVIVEDSQLLGLRLYNASYEAVSLDNYSLSIDEEQQTKNISLSDFTIDTKKTLTISFIEDIIGDINDVLEIISNSWTVKLSKGTFVLEQFDGILLDELESKTSIFLNITRNPSILKPRDTFSINEWYGTDTPFNVESSRIVNEGIISYKEQAKAFARYVMFGAGMRAKDRVEEAFLALRAEYELMHLFSIDYFLENPKEKVSGYDEDDKYVEVTFRNAHERISVLASTSGYPSFISTKRSWTLSFSNTILIIFLASISLLGFLVLMFIKNRKRKV